MKCQACGHVVQRRAQFCHHCGKPIIMRTRAPENKAASPRWPLVIGLVAGGVLLGAVAVQWLTPKETATQVTHNHFDGTLRGEALAARYPNVYQVASEFICPCGTCTDGLEVCDCVMPKGSSEVRTKIHDLLQVHEVPHAIALVEEEYGYRRSKPNSSLNLPDPSSTLPWAKPK